MIFFPDAVSAPAAIAAIGGALALFVACWRQRRLRELSRQWPAIEGASARRLGTARVCLIAVAVASTAVAVVERTDEAAADGAGAPLVFAMDISRSMEAADVASSRQAAVIEGLRRALDGAQPITASLVVFAGESLLLCPMTSDAGALRMALAEVPDVAKIIAGGSSIADGLGRALDAVPSEETKAAIVLISDGEDTVGDVRPAIAQAMKRRIPVHTIGVGTTAGIEMTASRGSEGQDNALVERRVTRLEERQLQEIAATTRGTYTRWERQIPLPIEALLKPAGPRRERTPDSGAFARAATLAAFLCLTIELALARASWR